MESTSKTLLLIGALILCSCSRDQFKDIECSMEHITVTLSPELSKLSMNDEHTKFEWNKGDAISIFNDKEPGIQSKIIISKDADTDVEIPTGTKFIYGLYPASDDSEGPSSAKVNIPAAQTQAQGGKLNGANYPLAALSQVDGSVVSLHMRPVAGALAINVYKTDGNISGETLQSIKITPLNNSGFAGNAEVDLTQEPIAYSGGDSTADAITVTLGNPQTIAGAKPSSPQTYGGQVFAVLGRNAYTKLKFEITTSIDTYKVVSSDTYTFDLNSKDFIITNINISNLRISVTSGLTGESITTADITDTNSGDFENPESIDDNDLDHDIIPDFSRVGYKYGDEPIPTLAVKAEISPASVAEALSSGNFADTTSYIQSVIDQVGTSGGGAVLLKEGTYNTHGILFIDYDNTVLRGEGTDKTVLMANGTIKRPAVYIGTTKPADESTEDNLKFAGRLLSQSSLRAADQYGHFGDTYIVQYTPSATGISRGASTGIAEEYVPVGRLYIEVLNPSIFAVGDDIQIYRPYSDDWISDIGMDKIAKNGREVIDAGTIQWNTTPSGFARYWARKVTGVRGSRIYLDAPVVQSIDASYGGGTVYKYTADRVSGSGIEYLTIRSDCYKDKTDPDSWYNNEWIDEKHAWDAVLTKMAEHCWIRNIDSYCFGFANSNLGSSSKNITVENCNCYEPVSIKAGGRRYAFNLSGAEMCLVKDCFCEKDRHGYITNVSRGPNVFLRCRTDNFGTAVGPHQHWGTGDLYDNVSTGNGSYGSMEAYDRGNAGTGHGWAGVNYVYWNCTSKQMTCQSPWARENTPELETMPGGYTFHSPHPSGRNYVIGFIGKRAEKKPSDYAKPHSSQFSAEGIFDYYSDLGFGQGGKPVRPEAKWYPYIEPNASGNTKVNLPDKTAASTYDWWPHLTLGTYSHPESLYECQLEDRHARGIFLNVY